MAGFGILSTILSSTLISGLVLRLCQPIRSAPFLFYQGTFYQAGMTDDAKAKIQEPWNELARAIGRQIARDEREGRSGQHIDDTKE
jgi:hypothetical protein